MPWRRRKVTNLIIFIMASGWQRICLLLCFLFVARWFTPDQVGLWILAITVYRYAVHAQLGVSYALSVEVPLTIGREGFEKAKVVSDIAYWWLWLITMATLAIVVAAVLVLEQPRYIAIAAGVMVGLVAQFREYWLIVARANERFNLASLIHFVAGVSMLALLVPAAASGSLAMVLIALAVCSALPSLLGNALSPPVRWHRSFFQILPGLLRLGFPMFLTTILFAIIISADRLMIGMAYPEQKAEQLLGQYTPAVLVNMIMLAVPQLATSYIYPSLGRKYGASGDPKELLRNALRYSFVFVAGSIPAAIIYIIFSQHLITKLLPKCTAGIPASRVICAAAAVLAFQFPFQPLLLYLKKKLTYCLIHIAALTVAFAVMYLAIRRGYGLDGVAWGMFVNYSFLGVLMCTVGFRVVKNASKKDCSR